MQTDCSDNDAAAAVGDLDVGPDLVLPLPLLFVFFVYNFENVWLFQIE